MYRLLIRMTICLLLPACTELHAQQLRFKMVLENFPNLIADMKQDKLGNFWINNTSGGLQKFDGIKFQEYVHDPGNPDSKAPGEIRCLFVDRDNIIWIGNDSTGLERLDPATNTFSHFRHNPNDSSSLSSDDVNTMLEDHAGNFWVVTGRGLDLLDRGAGKFTHFKHNRNDSTSISYPQVFKMYEDKSGMIWIYGRSSSTAGIFRDGLFRLNPDNKQFSDYSNGMTAIAEMKQGFVVNDFFEDRKNNFWISTNVGLYAMDRNTGRCTRYYPDPFHSGPLRQKPVAEKLVSSILFVTEDSSGALWIGMGSYGLNRYDPISEISMHFGPLGDDEDSWSIETSDTQTGLDIPFVIKGTSSKDGLFWVCGFGGIANLNLKPSALPLTLISRTALAFYLEENGEILWIGTDGGLLRKDLVRQKEKVIVIHPKVNHAQSRYIYSITAGENGKIWLGTGGGLVEFDPVTEKYKYFKKDTKNPGSISGDKIVYTFIDQSKTLWLATDSGISRMDRSTGKFTNYSARQISNINRNFQVNRITEDRQHNIWLTANWGIYKLDVNTGNFSRLTGDDVRTIFVDAKGKIWAGGFRGLYVFDKLKARFDHFTQEGSTANIINVVNIIEDNQENLWVTSYNAVFKINENRTEILKYAEKNSTGSLRNFWSLGGLKAKDGRLFLGFDFGYYSFYPDQLSTKRILPELNFTGFKLGDKFIHPEKGGILGSPVWQATEIRLDHNQNVFSLDFFAVDHINPGDEKYFFMLENYDDNWRDIGSEHRASFFNVPPGRYVFRVKAVNGDGGQVEKSIRVMISPPWWETWWFRLLSVVALVLVIYAIVKERSRKLMAENLRLEENVAERTAQLKKSLEELKSTQAQLIQSEKMASLGELTAGIAHEIQNPLNFVNNFSEVNRELIEDLKQEVKAGNNEEVIAIANDIGANEEKINHHGKRADAIVKGMLQHSSSGSGKKEPTDINALADEYLRLAYHGFKAKDKSFNAAMKTDFDENIRNVNVIPQDIGRVLLNLINNAFYAVHERSKEQMIGYEPAVTVRTKKVNGELEISISDNGNGIPEKVLDKVFQPFFTTKPTGQGTGLGLSLSYDIIKAHQGTINIRNTPGEGAAFIITLPINA